MPEEEKTSNHLNLPYLSGSGVALRFVSELGSELGSELMYI